MPGSSDTYVNEDLLKQLFGDDPETEPAKPPKAGKAEKTPVERPPETVPVMAKRESPAPSAAAEKLPAGAESEGKEGTEEAAAPSPEILSDTAVAATQTVVQVAAETEARQAAANPAWKEADDLFAAGEHARAAQKYLDAAVSSPLTVRGTLLYNSGVAWMEAGSVDPAIEAFEQSLACAPESRMVRTALGLAQLAAGQYAAALVTLETVYHPASGAAAVADDLDALEGQLRGAIALRQWDQAKRIAEAIVSVDEGNQSALMALLQVQIETRNDEAAEAAAREVLRRNAHSLDARFALMSLTARRGNFQSAAEHCDALVAAGAIGGTNTWLHAAAIYSEVGENSKAAEAYRKVLELEPQHAAAAWNLALIEEAQGNDREAEALLAKIAPGNEEWMLHLADLRARLEKYAEAETLLRAGLEKRAEWPEALFRLGMVLERQGKGEEAQESMLHALRLKPQETGWIEHLEALAIERNDPIVALDCQERLASLNAGTAELSYNVGVMLQLESEPELAAKCYIHALEQKPDFSEALLNLGHALYDLGREDEAKACWSKAVLLKPELAAGYFS